MMFDFLLNPRMWLALARQDAEPLVEGLTTAVRLPAGAQWVSFLRNHDELDLSRLTDEQRGDAFKAFAPRAGDAAVRPGHPPPAGPDAEG